MAGFVVVYIIKNDFLPQNTSNNKKTQTVAKVTSAPLPVGWKKYTNTDNKLQFAYPSTDTIQTKSYGFGISNLTLKTKKGTADFQILFSPKSLASAVGQNFDSYYAMKNNETKIIKNPLLQTSTTEKFTKIRNIKVNGNKALNYQSLASNAKPGSPPEIGTIIEAGDNLVLISTSENNKKKLDRMLNSFEYPL